MNILTDKEQQMFEYICDTLRREGYAPSVRDIQAALSIKSTSTVHSYLDRLASKGAIRKEDGKSRTLRVDGLNVADRNTAKVPMLGRIRAGMPILAVENLEGYIDFPLMNRNYTYNELFALRVTGDSMIDAGILEGDVVVVKKEPTADNGQIVVALIDDEATLKTFYKENGHFRLQPENPNMEPIIVDYVTILGRVVSVLRYY